MPISLDGGIGGAGGIGNSIVVTELAQTCVTVAQRKQSSIEHARKLT